MALAPVGLRATVQGVNQFNQRFAQMNRRMNLFGSSAQRVSRQVGGLTNSVNRLGTSVSRVGQTAIRTGLSMSFLASGPLIGAFVSSANAAAGFQKELIKINTLVGIPAQGVSAIRSEILGLTGDMSNLGLAIDTGRGASELASAAFFITSAGIRDAAEATRVLETSAKSSAIGLGETQVIANAITSVLKAYGEENISASTAADVLAAAVQRGKFQAEQLAPSLGKILGVTANMGVSFQEASAFIATYTLSGASASQATTGLQRTLLSILKPTAGARDVFNSLGTSAEMLQQNIRDDGLLNTLFALRDALEAQNIPLSEVFGRVTGLNSVLFNTGEAADLYVENLAAIEQANGLVENSFETVSQTTAFQIDQLKASFEVLGITVGSIFLPAINKAIQAVIPFVKAIADLANQHPRMVLIATVLGLIVAATGPLILGFGLFVSVAGSVISAVGTLFGVVAALVGPLGLLAAAALATGAAVVAVFAATIPQALIKANRGLGNTAQETQRFKDRVAENISKTEQDSSIAFGNMAKKAFSWGRNIIVQFAKGIVAGATLVIQALTAIGNAIASWLAPGSPPALLPDLPEWGESAMSHFIAGFANADFSVFNSIASTIEGFLRSFAPEDDVTLIPSIIGIREQIAGLIAQVREMGNISVGAIDNLVSNLGLANDELSEYVSLMLQVASASEQVAQIQEEIAQINSTFDSVIAPLNDELQAIKDRREEVVRQMRIEELQAIVDDRNADPLARELALMELREIELQNNIEAQEDLRDEAISAAEAQLAAAEEELAQLQEELNSQEELIKLQIDHNDLIKEQIKLLKKLAEVLDDVGSSGSIADAIGELPGLDIGGGLDLDIEPPEKLDIGDILGEDIVKATEDLQNTVNDIIIEIMEPVDNLKEAWKDLGDAWGPVVQQIVDGTIFDTVLKRLEELGLAFLNNINPFLNSEILGKLLSRAQSTMDSFSSLITAIGAGNFREMGFAYANFIADGLSFAWLGVEITGRIAGAIMLGLVILLGRMIEWFASVDWTAMWRNVNEAWEAFMMGVWDYFKVPFALFLLNMRLWFLDKKEDFISFGLGLALNILQGAFELVIKTDEWLDGFRTKTEEWVENNITRFVDAGKAVAQGFINGLQAKIGEMVAVVHEMGVQMRAEWDSFWERGSPSKVSMRDSEDIVRGMIQGYINQLPALINTVSDIAATQQAILSQPIVPQQVSAQPVVNNSVAINMGGVNINNGGDETRFRSMIRQEIFRAIGDR